MNDMEMLEQHLHSWTPRRPSRTLEARIFGKDAAADERSADGFVCRNPLSLRLDSRGRFGKLKGVLFPTPLPLLNWNWLAPVAVGCCALVVTVFSGRNLPPMMREASSAERSARLLANSAVSNREMVAYYTTDAHSSWNHWWKPILGWTNTLPVP